MSVYTGPHTRVSAHLLAYMSVYTYPYARAGVQVSLHTFTRVCVHVSACTCQLASVRLHVPGHTFPCARFNVHVSVSVYTGPRTRVRSLFVSVYTCPRTSVYCHVYTGTRTLTLVHGHVNAGTCQMTRVHEIVYKGTSTDSERGRTFPDTCTRTCVLGHGYTCARKRV
jgi:hypothetical protein